MSGPSSDEPETTPFVKEQQSRAALPLLVHSGRLMLDLRDARNQANAVAAADFVCCPRRAIRPTGGWLTTGGAKALVGSGVGDGRVGVLGAAITSDSEIAIGVRQGTGSSDAPTGRHGDAPGPVFGARWAEALLGCGELLTAGHDVQR